QWDGGIVRASTPRCPGHLAGYTRVTRAGFSSLGGGPLLGWIAVAGRAEACLCAGSSFPARRFGPIEGQRDRDELGASLRAGFFVGGSDRAAGAGPGVLGAPSRPRGRALPATHPPQRLAPQPPLPRPSPRRLVLRVRQGVPRGSGPRGPGRVGALQ